MPVSPPRLLGLLLLAAAVLPALPAGADLGLRPAVLRATDPGFGEVPAVAFPALDRALLAAEDALREIRGEPYRFAVPHPVYLTPESAGVWERLADGTLRWRLRVTAAGATSLNLGFGRFRLPPGGRLHLYAADGGIDLRPFTAEDNRPHGELWTPVLLAADAVVEVAVPEAERGQLELALVSINQGYRGFGAPSPDKSGACNVDVACPEGNGYRDVIRSVARITIGGFSLCSGAMVNNTAQNFLPLFLTANHCGINGTNDASVVFYWLFENSTCRPPGSPESGGDGDGSLSRSQSGSTLLASAGSSDFTLVELSANPASSSNVFWAGWDRSGGNPAQSVAIHHPQGDEKRISFENDGSSTTSYLGSSSPGDGTHIRVHDWDLGTTEGGSSGSPLVNQAKRVVGQLHGGFAACGNDDSDWYGRLSRSWTGGGSAATRLSDWLDPAGTGATVLNGAQPGQTPAPAAPSNLAAQAQSSTEVLLTWQDNATNETDFQIQARPAGGSFAEVGTAPANSTSRVVTGLEPATEYSFRVRARNAGGNSAFSNVATATTPSGSTLPAAPDGLEAEAQSIGSVLLTWNDRSTNETQFLFERQTLGGSFGQFAAVAADTTQLVVGGLDPATYYVFRLRASNAAGVSAYSNEAGATTDTTPAPCVADADTLCQVGGRFRIEMDWRFASGQSGAGQAVPLTDRAGAFYFLNADNLEMLVKMVNACALNGRYWVFYAATTNVEFQVTVTDTQTGKVRTYPNPLNTPAPPIQDTGAFATCP